MWVQREIALRARERGVHLVTDEVVDALPELRELGVGLLHLLIQHTSASLALNENASPEVRRDVRSWLDEAVPEDAPYWTHTLEGPDDMPAHMKSILTGASLTLPVSRRRARARHLAGDLPLRAPGLGRLAPRRRDAQRRARLSAAGSARSRGTGRRDRPRAGRSARSTQTKPWAR